MLAARTSLCVLVVAVCVSDVEGGTKMYRVFPGKRFSVTGSPILDTVSTAVSAIHCSLLCEAASGDCKAATHEADECQMWPGGHINMADSTNSTGLLPPFKGNLS